MNVMRLMMTMILSAALALPALVSPARADLVDLELILAVDISGSVDDDEARLQRAGTVAALTDEMVIRAIASGRLGRIAVAYVEWAGGHVSNTIVGWSVIDGAETARAFARRLVRAPLNVELWTSISGAIEYGLGSVIVLRAVPEWVVGDRGRCHRLIDGCLDDGNCCRRRGRISFRGSGRIEEG